MKKRYIILKNNVEIGEANTGMEIYGLMETTKQHYYKTLKEKLFNDGVNLRADRYNIIDRLNPKV